MRNKYKIILTIGLLLSFLFCSVAFIPGSGDCQSSNSKPWIPTVTIDLVQDFRTAQVGPGDTGKVTFNGIVNVDCKPNSDIMVYVNAEDTWGTAKVFPESFLFWESGEKSFTVTCRVRPRESTRNSGTVTVLGWWGKPNEGYSGYAQPNEGVKGIIEIAQFHKYTMKADQAFVELESGDEFLFNLHIQNRGNGMDTFKLNISKSR